MDSSNDNEPLVKEMTPEEIAEENRLRELIENIQFNAYCQLAKEMGLVDEDE